MTLHPSTAEWERGEWVGNGRYLSDPESPELLKYYQATLYAQQILDFGCGTGRLAHMFYSPDYVGTDICRVAIEKAREISPLKDFYVCSPDFTPSYGHAVLAHMVMLYIPDADLIPTLQRFRQKRLLIGEIIGRELRTPSAPGYFGRGIMDYTEALEAAGYRLHTAKDFAYRGAKEFYVLEAHRRD